MKKQDQKMIKKWVNTWEQAGSALAEVRQKELSNFDYAKNLPVLDAMLQWACDHKQPRLTSGLVEQQRYFMKIREKLEKSEKPERES